MRQLVGDDKQADVGKKVGASGPTVSRWLAGNAPDAKTAIALARAYGDSPLNALVAAGFLTDTEARVRPSGRPALSSLDDNELLGEIGDRLRSRAAGEERPDLRIAARTTGQEPGTSATRRAQDQIESGSQDPGDMEPR